MTTFIVETSGFYGTDIFRLGERMAEAELEGLLRRMPAIADAVNSFTSETVQHEAFQALVSAFFGGPHSTPKRRTAQEDEKPAIPPPSDGDKGLSSAAEAPATSTATRRKRAERRRSENGKGYDFKLDKSLDLHPTGKLSFSDFVEEKQPQSNQDRYAVVVYWLEQIAGIRPITLDTIGSVFRLTSGWKEPSNVRSGVTTCASRKGTIDTANFNDLKTTPRGRNFVDHELPPKPKKKG